jgi:raffinose/stachyose/melibiose transport system permease protein
MNIKRPFGKQTAAAAPTPVARFGSEKKTTWIMRGLVILYVLLLVYPVLFVVLTSLKPTEEFYKNIWGLPTTFAWSNYTTAWTKGNIDSAFITSIFVVVTTVVIVLLLGAMAGYALARLEIPKAGVITLAIVATTLLPTESVLIPEYLLTSNFNLVGTLPALIISYSGWGLPITIYVFRGFFLTIPKELIESARIDGAGEFTTFFKIIVPLMLPAIATNAILNFVGWWGELLWALVVLSGQADIRTLPFALVEFNGQFSTNWGPLSAGIVIVITPLIAFFLFTQKYFINGLTGGGVKG